MIAEGKTKLILEHPSNNPNLIIIKSKNDITSGDGANRDEIEGKSISATQTTVNCFNLLLNKGIKNHFAGVHENVLDEFVADKLEMIPIELVARRIAFGSYLKRNPNETEGRIFEHPVIEFFFKDDSLHDPLIILDSVRNKTLLIEPSKPIGEGEIIEREMLQINNAPATQSVDKLKSLTTKTFLVLEKAWAKIGVTLVDLKIECGINSAGKIVVGDVIDNDSWRIWPAGDKNQMMDKQVYRDLEIKSGKELGKIKDNYQWVAKQTEKFLLPPQVG